MMVYSASSGGGAEFRGSAGVKVQMQGCRRVVIALLVVMSTAIAHVHCNKGTSAPAPAPQQKIPLSFNQDEADALNAIFQNWTAKGLNQELITILNWTATASSLHPCNVSDKLNNITGDGTFYNGAWSGLVCSASFNSSTYSIDISVIELQVVGNNASCNDPSIPQCGFNGITGVLPSAISKLVNLEILILSNNNLSGNLPVSLDETLFNSTSLFWLDLSNNHFSGTFSAGPRWNCPDALWARIDLSNNDFTSITFANCTGRTLTTGTSYMPFLPELNVANNKLSGPFPMEVLQLYWLQILDLSGNNFSGPLPSTQWNSNLQYVYIQNNNFSGTFPSQILASPQLQEIYGDNNQYDALHLPDIGPFTNSTLFIVSLTNNKIEAVQYADKGSFTTFNLLFSNQLFLEGNPMCKRIESQLLSIICRMNQTSLPLTVLSKLNAKNKIIIAVSTSLAFISILMTVIYVWRLMLKIKSLHSILTEFEKNNVKPNLYSYKEIKWATKNFDIGNKLGEGGFGVVYKGELFDGSMVAVKKLTISSNQGLPEFLNEVVVISGLKHRNLVKLKGCCLGDGNQRILVFEYVENRNLGEALWIQGESPENIDHPCLDWTTRYNIIIGIARGLAYLHEDLQSPVIHRDIKAANILLDKDYNPKIADFGLAYLFPTLDNDETHLTLEQVAGTRGYCSPEYMLHGHISTALDVYSFGIMILEIVSGRKNIDRQKPSDEIYLLDWAWRQFEEHASMTLIDPKMKYSSSDLEAIIRVINVALACAQYKATRRPVMYDVVPMLLGDKQISKCSRGFDDGEYGDVVNFSNTTISSFMGNDNISVDECSLLGNTHEIEMSTMAL